MADLVVKELDLDGLDIDTPAFVAATGGGELFLNDGYTFVLFENGATQEVVATFDSVRDCDQGEDHNPAVTIPVSERRAIGPFDRGRFNDANGKIAISYGGAVTALTLAAISVKP